MACGLRGRRLDIGKVLCVVGSEMDVSSSFHRVGFQRRPRNPLVGDSDGVGARQWGSGLEQEPEEDARVGTDATRVDGDKLIHRRILNADVGAVAGALARYQPAWCKGSAVCRTRRR